MQNSNPIIKAKKRYSGMLQRSLNLLRMHFSHDDHRFEWSRAEFVAWAAGVAERHEYQVRLVAMGEEVEGVGAPSQLAVFSLEESAKAKS